MTKRILLALLLTVTTFTISFTANATPAWYVGKVSRIALIGNGFIVTFKNDVLKNCKHKYVYFTISKLDELRVNQAYSLALTSLTANVNMGVVFDIDANGIGGLCYAYGMAADLRAN